ncbi:MAG: hypothetical protein LBV44_04375 [Methylobacillus sp.]|jgi:hypothetical protein|nr:hypothetical protein [Methylobacillus sp.]
MTTENPDTPQPARRAFLKSWKIMVPLFVALVILVWLGFYFDVDKRVIVGGAVVYGLASSLFAWIVSALGLVPVVGPLLVKVLAIPLIWLLNAIGYLLSFIAIRRGYSRDVLTYRGLTISLLIGIVIGFILGRML